MKAASQKWLLTRCTHTNSGSCVCVYVHMYMCGAERHLSFSWLYHKDLIYRPGLIRSSGYLVGRGIICFASTTAMYLDNLPEPSGSTMSDLPGTVEQAVHQCLTDPLEWPLFHLKHTQVKYKIHYKLLFKLNVIKQKHVCQQYEHNKYMNIMVTYNKDGSEEQKIISTHHVLW